MGVDFEKIEALLAAVCADGREALYEHEVYRLLRAAGATVVPETVYVPRGERLPRGALDLMRGDRVVLKVVSPRIAHKSDVGGVRFVPRDWLRVSAEVALLQAGNFGGDGAPSGVLVCEFFEHGGDRYGNELFIGMRSAREFGPVIAAGLGGLHAEFFAAHLQKGHAFTTALALETSAEEFFALFERTVAYEILSGRARGTQRIVSDETLRECFEAFLSLARRFCGSNRGDRPAILELEVNPFAFVDGHMIPLDGLCRLGAARRAGPARPLAKIERLLHPRSIGVVGVSGRDVNMGRVILRNILACGFAREQLCVIKAGTDEIEGVRCVPSLSALPERMDLLVLAVPAASVPELAGQIIELDAAESVIVIPGGFGETAGGAAAEQKLREAIERSRLRPSGGPVFLGGNCLGIQSRPGHYDTMFIPADKLDKRYEKPGHAVALISQSGAYVVSRISTLSTLDPQYAISCGNQFDLTVSDLLRHLADSPRVDVFGVYVEGFRDLDGLAFADAVREATARDKDVIFYKAGRTSAGRSATAGHTASIAGDYNVCEAAAANAGALVASTFKEFEYLIDIAADMHGKRIGGRRIGAISNAGFEAVGMADATVGPQYRVELPAPAEGTRAKLAEILRAHRLEGLVNVANPLDLTPMANEEAYEACVRSMLESAEIDAVVVSCVPLTPAMRTTAEELREGATFPQRLARLARETDKPLVMVIDAGSMYEPLSAQIRETGIPVFRAADSAVRSLGRYMEYRLGRGSKVGRSAEAARPALASS